MAVIPTPEQSKPILDFSAGTFDGNSNLFQSRNGATEHVNGDDVADYVNTSRIYNGLETSSKTPVGAINELNRKDASDIAYDNTSSGLTATNVQGAIDEINAIPIDAVTVNGHTVNKDVPSNAKFTDTLFYFSISKDESSISSTSVAPLSVSRGIGLQVEVDPDGVTPTDISLFTTSDAYSYTSKANGNTGYMLITIKPETTWMLSFTLNFYGNYNAYSVEISGYNYSTNHWYKPNAQLLYSSDGETSKTVYFGYTGDLKLWVAVPKSSYQGLSITNITNGHTKITDMASDIFDISDVSSLPGTTQETVNAVNNSVINLIYPVGSIYMSVTNANPGTWMVGTTWVAWGSGTNTCYMWKRTA